MPARLAVIVAVPTPTALTSPFSTVATFLLEDVHLTASLSNADAGVPSTVSVFELPFDNVKSLSLMLREESSITTGISPFSILFPFLSNVVDGTSLPSISVLSLSFVPV